MIILWALLQINEWSKQADYNRTPPLTDKQTKWSNKQKCVRITQTRGDTKDKLKGQTKDNQRRLLEDLMTMMMMRLDEDQITRWKESVRSEPILALSTLIQQIVIGGSDDDDDDHCRVTRSSQTE